MSGRTASWLGGLLLAVAGGLLAMSAVWGTQVAEELKLAAALTILALTLLGIAVGLQANAPLVVRQILLWTGAGLIAATAIGFRAELMKATGLDARLATAAAPPEPAVPGLVALKAEAGGHFFADALVNGSFVRFLVDTGATEVALTHEDALRLGLPVDKLDYDISVRTANGMTEASHIYLQSVVIGTIRIEKVSALVTRGALDQSLLGMSFLKRLGSLSVDSDRLIMRQ